MKIKVCGMRNPDNIRALIKLDPDYIGFIFYPQSKRFISQVDHNILNEIPDSIKKTGVFVDASLSEIQDIVKKNQLNAVQLHGNESVDTCRVLQELGIEVIKAFGVDESFDFTMLEPYTHVSDHFLFDTKTPLHGGSGISFDWKILENYKFNTSYFISGGLSLESLPSVKNIKDDRLYAADLNSRFETEPGMKDIHKLEEAITLLRS